MMEDCIGNSVIWQNRDWTLPSAMAQPLPLSDAQLAWVLGTMRVESIPCRAVDMSETPWRGGSTHESLTMIRRSAWFRAHRSVAGSLCGSASSRTLLRALAYSPWCDVAGSVWGETCQTLWQAWAAAWAGEAASGVRLGSGLPRLAVIDEAAMMPDAAFRAWVRDRRDYEGLMPRARYGAR